MKVGAAVREVSRTGTPEMSGPSKLLPVTYSRGSRLLSDRRSARAGLKVHRP